MTTGTMHFETLIPRKWCSRAGAVRNLQKGDVLEKVPKRSQNGAKMHAKSDHGRPRTPKERPGGDFDSFWCASRAAWCPKKGVPKTSIKMVPQQIIKNRFWRARGGPGTGDFAECAVAAGR